MISKRTLLLALFATRVLAGPALFDKLNPKQAIVLVLPDGTCDAKVVERKTDSLTARLKDTTRLCGKRKTLVRVLRADVQDVVDGRSTPHRDPETHCALIVALAAVTGGLYVGERFETQAGLLAVVAAGGVAGALICRDHRPRYGVFVERIIPPQP